MSGANEQALIDRFDKTWLKIAKLIEARSFYTYFYFGPIDQFHRMSPVAALKFYDDFQLSYRPLLYKDNYIEWLATKEIDPLERFVYEKVNKVTHEPISGQWVISDILNMRSYFENLNYSSNNIDWNSFVNNKITDSESLALIAAFFTSGKFIVYYDTYIKNNNDLAKYNAKFNPVTALFNDKYYYDDPAVYQLFRLLNNFDQLFCYLCTVLAYTVPDEIKNNNPKKGYVIQTIWDTAPHFIKDGIPETTIYNSPFNIIQNTDLIKYVKYFGRLYMSQIGLLKSGKYAFKDLWYGTEVRVTKDKKTTVYTAPFYFVASVNWNTENNVYKGNVFDINAELEQLKKEQEENYNELVNVLASADQLNICTAQTTIGDIIYSAEADDNITRISSSCILNTSNKTDETINDPANNDNKNDDEKVEFSLNGTIMDDEFITGLKDINITNTIKDINYKTIIYIVTGVVGFIIFVIIIVIIIKRKKLSAKKDDDSIDVSELIKTLETTP